MTPLLLDRRALLVVALLAALTLALFGPVVRFQFINVDDNVYVTGNHHIQQGLSWHNAAWALTSLEAANWHPATWLSHLLDVSIFGLNPAGHHTTSLLLHTLNVILLFLFLRYMTRALWQSAIVAALFAVHPLALESVAWIAERKNVLSTFFLLLTLWSYVAYTRKPALLRYLLVAFCFVLGLMSKPMLVTVPLALLLLDYWPLQRLTSNPKPEHPADVPNATDSTPAPAHIFLQRCLEKVPLLLFAVASSILTLKAQTLDREIKLVSLSSRIANAILSYAIYLWQMLWPAHLAIFYPYRDRSILSAPVILSLLLLSTITALVIWQLKQRPYLAVGWFWYLGTLVPAVGLVHVGDIAHADRYTYVPLLGIFIAIVWGLGDIETRFPSSRRALFAAAGIAVVALALTTAQDISYWHDGISISEHSLAATGPNCLMERALGEAFYDQGRSDEALVHLVLSSQIEPTDTSLFEIGTIKFQQKRFDEAAFYYQKALQFPGEPQTISQIHNNLAVLEMQQGAFTDAGQNFQASIALDPTSSRHRVAYGWLLVKLGRYDEAITQYQQALAIAPDALAYFSLGSALEEQHRLPEAAAAYRNTVALAPDFQDAQLRLKAIADIHPSN